MSESTFPQESASSGEIPQFGAVDIVEAFTAMRHEWRGQTKESLALAERIQAVAANLRSLESKLLDSIAAHRSDDSVETKQLALSLVETDQHLSRATTAIAQWEKNRRLREAADARALEQGFAAMSPLARWFARPLFALISEQRSLQVSAAEHPAIEGLNMVLARLRRLMRERDIERLEVQGQPFDAETMVAIGTVESADCASGHIAEQLSPAYRWKRGLLRFAEVRVAK